jgi:ankyrin repeat protein
VLSFALTDIPSSVAGPPKAAVPWAHPVFHACATGRNDALEKVLAVTNTGGDAARDPEGWTGLMYAAVLGNSHTAEVFVKHGADVEARSSRDGRTALMAAAAAGQADMVTWLLERGGVRLDDRDDRGMNALLLAAAHGQVGPVATKTARCNQNYTIPLPRSQCLATVSQNVSQYPYIVDKNVETTFVLQTQAAVVERLVKQHHCPVDTKDGEGRTAYQIAAAMGHQEIMGLLVGARDDSDSRLSRGVVGEVQVGGYQ